MVLLLTGRIIQPTRQALGSNVVMVTGLKSALLERMLRTTILGTTLDMTAPGAAFRIACEQQTKLEPLHMRLVTTAVVMAMSNLRSLQGKAPHQVRSVSELRQKTWPSWLVA